MLGMKLEAIQAGREDRLPQISAALEPLRVALREHRWLGGSEPNYADYRIIGPVLFLASVSTVPALASDDPLRDWIERCRDLFGGIGRHQGLNDIYGLEQRAGDPDLFQKVAGAGGPWKRNTGPASTRTESDAIGRPGV